jgi:K+-sensing histidine kinase KdpD
VDIEQPREGRILDRGGEVAKSVMASFCWPLFANRSGSAHGRAQNLFYKIYRKSKGTGADLAIVKRIVEVHVGRIWIESEQGKGCSVCFTLPLSGKESEARQ